MAGFKPVLAVDWDSHALETYRLNHPGTLCLQRDIRQVTANDVLAASGGKEIDLIAGGPSCQGYSTHGKRKEEDERNYLFEEFVRLVREVQPRFFLMENVKGLLAYRRGVFKAIIQAAFAKAGYRVTSQVLCAADYGVPQLRHRIVFLGTRSQMPLSFPEPTHGEAALFGDLKPHITVGEAIGDLPSIGKQYDRWEWPYASGPQNAYQRYARRGVRLNSVTLHQANPPSSSAKEIISRVPAGKGIRSLPPEDLPERFRKMRTIKNGDLRRDCTTLYFRLAPDRPAYTITCYFRNVTSGPFVHPSEDRALSYREAARLMSFPDSYVFSSSMLTRQIGNAVPPLLAKALGNHITELLRRSVVRGRSESECTEGGHWASNVGLDPWRATDCCA
jgi:DNA (cytosine-5)-methyltransferase 1